MDKVTLINPADYTPDGDPLLHLLAACVRFRLIALIMTSVLMKDLINPSIYIFYQFLKTTKTFFNCLSLMLTSSCYSLKVISGSFPFCHIIKKVSAQGPKYNFLTVISLKLIIEHFLLPYFSTCALKIVLTL